jgi:ATP-binding cassette subfamily F protein uup
MRVLEAVEDISMRVDLGKGRDLSASQLCERLGFGADTQWTPVGDLSGGERHRLQLTRILMAGPNVLFLDEPTNDFDVETLASLEDLLDGFAGTIIVVSHDRYFLERVCDNMIALMGDGNVRDLPRGIDQYLELRESMNSESGSSKLKVKGDSRSDQKELSKIEKRLQKVDQLIFEQKALIAGIVDDYQRLTTLEGNLQELLSEKGLLEERWLVLDELIRG